MAKNEGLSMEERYLRNYQKEIIGIIMNKETKEKFIQMPTGSGKNFIINTLIELWGKEKNVLIYVERLFEIEELNQEYKNITIIDDKHVLPIKKYDYIIINEIGNMQKKTYDIIKKIYENSIKINFLSKEINENEDEDYWLNQIQFDYKLTLKNLIDEGYITPYQAENQITELVVKILKRFNYVDIKREVPVKVSNKIRRIDLVASNDINNIVMEIKAYRSQFIQNNIIQQLVERMKSYQKTLKMENNKKVKSILVVTCLIDDITKRKVYEETNIQILDISNLFYLVQGDVELTALLVDFVPPGMTNMIADKPIDKEVFKKEIKEEEKNEKEAEQEVDKALKYIERLNNLATGRDDSNDKEYEKLCFDIIKYLFETEFTIMSEQNRTKDKMFRMDLVCGLKGISEFWKIFIQHYNTRFVVFEFKNYKEKIEQNLIYITEKYLYNATLRNVAIIVSRKGFSDNAYIAAKGALTENGKLIIDIRDEDLVEMLRMKADGLDASDYMLGKLEKYLISISK